MPRRAVHSPGSRYAYRPCHDLAIDRPDKGQQLAGDRRGDDGRPHNLISAFQAAAVRATLALEELNQQSSAEPMRRISTGGMLGGPQQKALSVGAQAMPVIEQAPVMEIESNDEQPVATNARWDQSLYHRDRE
jgi:hypothetical protein